ncbi:hypothetical protein VM1G_08373 [Cytospora mali]|uniref:Uncharacterized protein n=1 Tax=Cytospora mali TaxID=578113 RepID=A0A194W998_CYTMA|nr:hypothetical protein VM1G_08373 [Valsa mali]
MSQQQFSFSQELLLGDDTDSRVYMELVLGYSAAKAARDQHSSFINAEALTHARWAIDIARANNRSDLEEKAQLGKAKFLLMMGRERESLEVEIIMAAKAEGLMMEEGEGGSILSVGGVSMDEVTKMLMDSEPGDESSSPSGLGSQHDTDSGDSLTNTGEYQSRTGSSAPNDTIWYDTIQGRRIRDVRGHLITVTSAAPNLRRKPAFKSLAKPGNIA